MKTYIFLLILSVGFSALGQPTTFNQKYDFGYPAAIIQGIVGSSDSIIISGFVGDYIAPYPNRSFVGVANQVGDIQYFKILDTTNKDYWIYPASITKNISGEGYFTSGVFVDSANIRGFLWKIDKNLHKIFTHEYYPTNLPDDLQVENHVSYNKDTIMLVCSLWEHNIQGNLTDIDIVLIIADSLGNELKRLQYGEANYKNRPYCLQKCDKGLLYAGAKNKRFYDNGVWKYEVIPEILLFDNQGNILKAYNQLMIIGDYTGSLWVTATKDGGYMFCGSRLYNVVDPMGTPNQAQLYSKGYIEKLDSNFVKQWGRTIGNDSLTNYFSKIIPIKDGNYIAVGTTAVLYKHNFSPDSVQIDSAKVEGWAVKISPSGNVIWNRHYLTLTCKGDHIFSDVLEQEEGSLVMCGVAYDETPGTPATNAWLVKTDSFGCLVPGCETVGIAENTPIENSLKLYPNPTNDRLFLYYNNPQYKNFVFAITDLTGREVVPNTPLQSSTTYEIVVRDWAKGMYFVRVFDTEGRNVYTEKFVKE